MVVYILLSARRTAYFGKSIAIEMGGVSRYFSEVSGSGVDLTLLSPSVFVKCLVKFDLEFDLKFEICDGNNLVKFLGRTFLPARKARKISWRTLGQTSEQISEQISEASFQISRLFSETSFSRRAVLKVC